MDRLQPITDEVKFEYVKTFTLLGVEIDNKAENLKENFISRKKKIRTKIAIWRKLNLNTIGNLIVAKTFLILQLGYLLSMMECPKEILDEIQGDIDSFILKNKTHWVSKDRIHMEPKKGGLGAINLEIYATSLRCSWYKRINSGLWSDIILDKVNKKENVCFIKENNIHKMHIAIKPIIRAWETLQSSFVENKDDLKELKRPLNNFEAVKIGRAMKQIDETNCKFRFNRHGICETSAYDLTNVESIHSIPRLKTNAELEELLGITNKPFFERITTLTKVKEIWRKMTTDYSFKSDTKHTSLKEVLNNTKKGSKNYKAIILQARKSKNKPAETINKTWKISEKYEMTKYFEKTFSFWKLSFLPANLQNLHLQIVNHKLKMNDQLKHFAKDENNDPVKGDCTFCKLNGIENPCEESYKHIFVECAASRAL